MGVMRNTYRVNQAADYLGVTPSTVRFYCNNGELKHDRTPKGQRIFKKEYLGEFLGNTPDKTTVFYTRSFNGDKQLLESQTQTLKHHYGDPEKIYSDKASGLNENRPGLNRLIRDARTGKFDRVAVTRKDRLSRFGFKYLEDHLDTLGVETVVLDSANDKKSLHDELLADFMALVASFSGRFYKIRGIEQQRKLLEDASRELESSK